MPKCPYCGKNLYETERYCWHCEQDISKVINKEEEPKISLKAKTTLLDDIKEVIEWIKNKAKGLKK